jgi:outer membrane protein
VVLNTAFLALHGGADDEITPNWLADINAKTLFLRPDIRMNSGLAHAGVKLDPWAVGASTSYRF